MKNRNNIESISITMYEDAEENTIKHPIDYLIFKKYATEIDAIDLNGFIEFNGAHFDQNYFNKLLLYIISNENNHTKINWEEIFVSGNNKVSYKCIVFLTKYCSIDSLYYYTSLDSISIENKKAIIADFKSYSSYLIMHSIDREELDEVDEECNVKPKLSIYANHLIEAGLCRFDPQKPFERINL